MNVAIIGAGPAGASCALLLARAGLTPLLFDHSHPRDKACAGHLTPGDLAWWGPLARFRGARPFDGDRWYTTPAGRSFVVPGGRGDGTLFVSRLEFDGWLAAEAAAAGARWVKARVCDLAREGRGWRVVIADGGSHPVDVVVGADGVRSLVRARTVGPYDTADLVTGVGYRYPGVEIDYMHTVLIDDRTSGFVMPGAGRAQVIVGGRGIVRGRRILDAFAARHFRGPRPGACFGVIQPAPRHPSFFDAPRAGTNFVLLGDAAGFCNRATGDGIRYAIESAHAAAAAIVDGRVMEYEGRWRDTFGGGLIEACRAAARRRPGPAVEAAAIVLSRGGSVAALARAAARRATGITGGARITPADAVRAVAELLRGRTAGRAPDGPAGEPRP